jgi:hypothetical protein
MTPKTKWLAQFPFSPCSLNSLYMANVKLSGDAGRPSLIDDPYIDRHAEVVARYHQGSLR